MQARALIMLVVAVVFGIIAVVLVNNLLTQKAEERVTVDEVATRPVLVAAVDLPIGTRLEAEMLKTVDWNTWEEHTLNLLLISSTKNAIYANSIMAIRQSERLLALER